MVLKLVLSLARGNNKLSRAAKRYHFLLFSCSLYLQQLEIVVWSCFKITSKTYDGDLKGPFYPWCNAVICLCFQIALLLKNALWLAIYFYRLAFSTGKRIEHSKFRARCLGWFLDRIVLIILEIGISYSWKWMNPLPTMNPSKEKCLRVVDRSRRRWKLWSLGPR